MLIHIHLSYVIHVIVDWFLLLLMLLVLIAFIYHYSLLSTGHKTPNYLLYSPADSPHSCCMQIWMNVYSLFSACFEYIHQSGVLTQLQHYLVVMWLVLHETAAISAHILCTPYNHVPVYSVTLFKAMCACVFSCILYFWQNDLDLLHVTVVTLGWNRYQNKSVHRKLTLE